MDYINLATIISVAFLGSFGHCVGMCGGFVIAYTSSKIPEFSSTSKQLFFHFIYNFGRISSYALIGAVCGYFGSFVSLSFSAKGYLFFIIGIFMVLVGLSLMGKIGFLKSVESSLAAKPFVKRIFKFLLQKEGYFSFYLLGVLNGFVPCGLVYFFAASAIASSSVGWGAIIMIIFGISTLPAMIGFGFMVSFLTQGGFRDVVMKIAGVVIILYGIYLSFSGYMLTMEAVN